jgi:hypothetical protein
MRTSRTAPIILSCGLLLLACGDKEAFENDATVIDAGGATNQNKTKKDSRATSPSADPAGPFDSRQPIDESPPDQPLAASTVRERCERLWGAMCDRWITCGFVTGEAAESCLTLTVDGCCAGSYCVSPDSANPATVSLCESDIIGRSCAIVSLDMKQKSIPSSCEGLLFY